jgi:branched-chain amino acid transport system ATP-binding protein
LSGGEQQMLAIGRALMTNPRAMILDEATEGLAPRIVADIWRVIAAIRVTGISTIVVDRNFRTVLAHTDRVLLLEKGRVALAGASEDFKKDHGSLARLLGV